MYDARRPSTKQPSLPSRSRMDRGSAEYPSAASRDQRKEQGRLQCRTTNGQKTATTTDRRANVVRASPKSGLVFMARCWVVVE